MTRQHEWNIHLWSDEHFYNFFIGEQKPSNSVVYDDVERAKIH